MSGLFTLRQKRDEASGAAAALEGLRIVLDELSEAERELPVIRGLIAGVTDGILLCKEREIEAQHEMTEVANEVRAGLRGIV